ncbi:MAG: hypothetical protein ACREF5_00790 [Candidatus Saccharimonadales bacterium]
MKTKNLIKVIENGLFDRSFGLKYPKSWLAILTMCSVLIVPAVAGAVTLISQGFLTNSDLADGSIVSLEKNSSDYVNPATVSNANNILGVVIDSEESQVSVSTGQGNQVQVATNGVEQVLVSNINGNISEGDPITASPISGVGMKATSNTSVVGIAQGVLPNSTDSQQTYTEKNGQKHVVTVGQVPVLVNVAYYYKQPNKTLIPPAVQSLANALANKTVSSLPIIISIGIFFITLIVVVIIIYSMIHSSIISIGRNPMSQAAVYRNVIQLSGLVVVILAVAVIAIYMVLTRF